MVAIETPTTAFLLGNCFSKNIEKSGTKMTLNPVMNPALEVVVYNKPTV
jgi:hypothetical protein